MRMLWRIVKGVINRRGREGKRDTFGERSREGFKLIESPTVFWLDDKLHEILILEPTSHTTIQKAWEQSLSCPFKFEPCLMYARHIWFDSHLF